MRKSRKTVECVENVFAQSHTHNSIFYEAGYFMNYPLPASLNSIEHFNCLIFRATMLLLTSALITDTAESSMTYDMNFPSIVPCEEWRWKIFYRRNDIGGKKLFQVGKIY